MRLAGHGVDTGRQGRLSDQGEEGGRWNSGQSNGQGITEPHIVCYYRGPSSPGQERAVWCKGRKSLRKDRGYQV